jgi:hypothetical protein
MIMETVTAKQIHSDFDNASEILYRVSLNSIKEANVLRSVEKSNRLKKLGFSSSSEVIESVNKETLPLYYRRKYPFHKFITREQLEELCEKYGLIYAEATRYTGVIPEKNLLEIENAKTIEEVDKFDGGHLLEEEDDEIRRSYKERIRDKRDVLSPEHLLLEEGLIASRFGGRIKSYAKNLFVAANKEYFDLKRLEAIPNTHGYAAVAKDPIVFRWVKGGVLIITKWGEEANDPALVIPELN